MARKGRDLAGLAALGALGYMLSKGDKAASTGGGKMPVAAAAPEAAREEDPEEAANKRTERTLIPNERGAPGTSETVFPSNRRPTATTAPSAATGLKNPGTGNQRGPSAEELAAYAASRRTGSGGGRGPRAGEAEAYAANRNVNFGNEGRSRPTATNTGSVKDIPTGGPAGYSGVKGERIDSSELGRNVGNTLAAMGPGKLSGVSKIGYEMRNADAIRKAAMAKEVPVREAVTNPLSWMAGPKNAGKFSGEVPAAGRESVTNPMAWMSGPKGMKQFEEAAPSMTSKAMDAAERLAARFRKKPLSESDTTGGAIGYKRGGSVKPKKMASGGMARSGASKRADGIATKGKTRGKIY
jgi:hypothetical protein